MADQAAASTVSPLITWLVEADVVVQSLALILSSALIALLLFRLPQIVMALPAVADAIARVRGKGVTERERELEQALADVQGQLRNVQEQLRQIVKTNSVKLVDLFADWDEDGNGGLDKKEFRKGIAALGYDAPNKDIDACEYCLALRAHTLIRSSCGGGRTPVHMRIACSRSCSVRILAPSASWPHAPSTRLFRRLSTSL